MVKSKSTSPGGRIELAVIYVGDLACGIETYLVKEINKNLNITPVPGVPPCIRGVLNLRGQILTVIDLRERLGLEPRRLKVGMKLVVISDQGEDICLLVDGVSDVLIGDKKDVEPPPSNIGEIEGAFLTGILKTETSLVAILNVHAVTGCESAGAAVQAE